MLIYGSFREVPGPSFHPPLAHETSGVGLAIQSPFGTEEPKGRAALCVFFIHLCYFCI